MEAREGMQKFYWTTRNKIWLLRQKPLFFLMNAFIASICEEKRTNAILMGSGDSALALQWYNKGFTLRKLSEGTYTTV